jgi:NitT/TauT family transport system substrate-binding protein
MKLPKLPCFALAICFAAPALVAEPALAENKVRIMSGYALTLLPQYVVIEHKLIEKQAEALGLKDVSVDFNRSPSAVTAAEALITDQIDVALYAAGPMLNLWDKTGGRFKGIMSVSAYSSNIYTVDPKINSIDDLGPNDRVAMTDIKTSNQAIILQMKAASERGWDKRFYYEPNLVAMANEDTVAALVSGATEVKSAMLAAPYGAVVTDAGARKIFASEDFLGEKISAGMLYGSVKWVDANPVLFKALTAAYEEAEAWIKENPEAAAEIYVKYEPQKNGKDFVVKLLHEDDSFVYTTTPKGVKRFADYMLKSGLMANEVKDWKDVFFDSVAGKEGS